MPSTRVDCVYGVYDFERAITTGVTQTVQAMDGSTWVGLWPGLRMTSSDHTLSGFFDRAQPVVRDDAAARHDAYCAKFNLPDKFWSHSLFKSVISVHQLIEKHADAPILSERHLWDYYGDDEPHPLSQREPNNFGPDVGQAGGCQSEEVYVYIN